MLATVTLLMLLSTEVSLMYFNTLKNQLFKEMFFALKNLIVLSTVMYKDFLAKIDAHKCFNM